MDLDYLQQRPRQASGRAESAESESARRAHLATAAAHSDRIVILGGARGGATG